VLARFLANLSAEEQVDVQVTRGLR
jgi:hypothetical protein